MMARLFETIRGIPEPKILTIQDLDDLDDAALRAVHEAQTPVKLSNGTH